jgi:hypothetical protein
MFLELMNKFESTFSNVEVLATKPETIRSQQC